MGEEKKAENKGESKVKTGACLLPQLSNGGKKMKAGFCRGSKKCQEKRELAAATRDLAAPIGLVQKKPLLSLEERAARAMDAYVYSAEWDADCERFYENLEQ